MATPYRLLKYAFSAKEERDAAKASSIVPGFYGHFPSSFGLYYAGPGKDYMSHQCFIGENAAPQYAVTFHDGPGLRQATLYATPEPSPPPLAIAANEKRYSSNAVVTLPAPPGAAGSTQIEHVKYKFTSNSHGFTIKVGSGSDQRLETFEWHTTKGGLHVRKLIRLSGGEDDIVATWTEGKVPNKDGRVATFRFPKIELGEELGEYWALMAVISALRVCQSAWYVHLAPKRSKSRSRCPRANTSTPPVDYVTLNRCQGCV